MWQRRFASLSQPRPSWFLAGPAGCHKRSLDFRTVYSTRIPWSTSYSDRSTDRPSSHARLLMLGQYGGWRRSRAQSTAPPNAMPGARLLVERQPALRPGDERRPPSGDARQERGRGREHCEPAGGPRQSGEPEPSGAPDWREPDWREWQPLRAERPPGAGPPQGRAYRRVRGSSRQQRPPYSPRAGRQQWSPAPRSSWTYPPEPFRRGPAICETTPPSRTRAPASRQMGGTDPQRLKGASPGGPGLSDH